MRVIAGIARGVTLRAPKSRDTRPISDRAKESLFNILSPYVEDSAFLDLFAGTGAVGIEALSRGAASATFVEWSGSVLSDLRSNLSKARLGERAKVVQADVFEFLKRQAQPYDIVFIAPPQWKQLWPKALRLVDARPGWLAASALVVVQHDPREDDEGLQLNTMLRFDTRTYGGVRFVFYERTRYTDCDGG